MTSLSCVWVGDSAVSRDVLRVVEKIATFDTSVLVTGESGSGKELVGRLIHKNSYRALKPFIVMNCATVPPELFESELFSRLQMAHQGVFFLDTIESLPLFLQLKFLQMIQSRQIDARIIAASDRDLRESVQKNEFREDLYYHLNAISFQVPPLRERKSDIHLLVNHFVQQFNVLAGYSVEPPTGQIMDALLAYDWPGNVRELENLMERLVILKARGSIDLGDLPHRIFQKYAEAHSQGAGALSEWEFPKMALPESGINLKSIVSAFENHLVDQALVRTRGNKNKASGLLEMNRTTLVEKLRKRGMIVSAIRKKAEGE